MFELHCAGWRRCTVWREGAVFTLIAQSVWAKCVFSALIQNLIQRGGATSMTCDITNSSEANPGPTFSSVMWKLVHSSVLLLIVPSRLVKWNLFKSCVLIYIPHNVDTHLYVIQKTDSILEFMKPNRCFLVGYSRPHSCPVTFVHVSICVCVHPSCPPPRLLSHPMAWETNNTPMSLLLF